MLYRYQNLTVKSDLKIMELHSLEIHEAVNQHTGAILTGICEPDGNGGAAGQKITVSDGENGLVFAGRTCGLEQHKIGGVVYFKLHACSFSSFLDHGVSRRVIQNQNRSYRELLALILGSYPPASFDGGTDLDSKLPALVVQNQETDWEFIKRLASQIGQGVVPDSASEQVHLLIGLTDGGDELAGLESWRKTFQVGSGKELLRIKTKRRYHPGSRLRFQGKWYYVEACDCCLVRNEIFYCLQMVQGTGGQVTSQGFPNQEGVRLGAYVKEVNRNLLRLQFEDEAFAGGGKLPWFPYSGEVNNEAGFYMPRQGAEVEVLCTGLYGGSAVVTGAMRRPPKQNTVQDVTGKVMGNEHGIGFGLGETNIWVRAGEPNQLEFLADGTVVLLGAEQVTLKAKGNLVLESSGGRISIEAGRSMGIVSGRDGCGQVLFDTEGNIRCKSTLGIQYKSGILPADKGCGPVKKMEKGLRENTMAVAGTEFLAQSVAGGGTGFTGNYIKDTILDNDERLFCMFSYGENKNGG